MSTEDNKAIARHVIEEGWNQGNTAVFDEVYATNYVGHDPSMTIQGPEGFKQVYAVYRTAFPDLHLTIEDIFAEGEKVVTRLTVRGTHRGELMGILPTGKQVTFTGIVISHFANGKIVESWYNFDDLGLMQQLGVIPAPGQAS